MSFIVIEGDNGTGKDTITQIIADKLDYEIVSYFDDIKSSEMKAKQLANEERITAFLEYNKKSGMVAKKHKKSILIRYWISTLAAAYADKIYSMEQIITALEEIKADIEAPALIIRLKCNFTERVERINERNVEKSELIDDVSIGRSLRYSEISEWLLKESGYTYFEIYNNNGNIEDTCNKIIEKILEVSSYE